MKKILSFILSIITLVTTIFSFGVFANAATTLKDFKGTFSKHTPQAICNFTVPNDTKLKFDFDSAIPANIKVYKYDEFFKEHLIFEKNNIKHLDIIKAIKEGNYKVIIDSIFGKNDDSKKDYDYSLNIKDQEASSAIPTVTPSVDTPIDLSIKLNTTKKSLTVGKSATLAYTTTPVDTTVTWTSSNKNVATVNSKGKVTAKALGKCTITAKLINGKTAKCTITVNKDKTKKAPKGLSTSLSGKIKNIKNYKKAKWSTSNSKIATVDKNGKVKGKKKGKCNIVATIDKQKYTIPVSVVSQVELAPSSVKNGIAKVKVTNNTNKKIKKITLQIYQYDKNGKKLPSPHSDYYIQDVINKNCTTYYSFNVNKKTKTTKTKLYKVWYTDGTTYQP